MPSVNIIIDLVGEPSGVPGEARSFLYSKIATDVERVSLSLDSSAGITTWFWEIVDKPLGSTATLSTPTASTTYFDATIAAEGTYLIRCTINSTSAGTNAVAFLTENLELRKFAAGENLEFGANGWTTALNEIIDAVENGGGGGGGGSGDTYTNLNPMPEAVGGLEKDSTFSAATMSEMFDGLLYGYQYPAFTAFAISGQALIIEVGSTIATNRTFTWTTSHSAFVKVNSISLIDVTGGNVTVASGLADDSSQATSYPAAPIQKTTATTHQFRIDGQNTNLDTFSTTYTVTWQWKIFYGESVTVGPLIEANIEALRISGLAASFAGSYVFVAGGYKYICYPASFGTAINFTDTGTGLNVPFEASYTVNVTNSYSQTTSYRVHRSTNIIGSAITILVS